MKKQVKENLSKLFVVVAVAIISTGAVFAQKPNRSVNNREQFSRLAREQAQTKLKTLADQGSAANRGAVTLANGTNFNLGKDFAMAVFDAEGIDEDEESYNYTILNLVFLIDSLEGQPEAVQLQKTLKSVVRFTSDAATVKKEIEAVSKTYLARQKVDGKWYFNAGQASMNLMISTYMGEDAQIKKGLAELQALIKVAPKNTPKEIINPINSLAQYAAKTAYTEADYTAIYESLESVMEAVSA